MIPPQIIVIGSGPAGLHAGYAAAVAGAQVTLLEQMDNTGAKLLASGGGRCNVSNLLPLEDFARKFGVRWRFMLPALREFSGEKLQDFFAVHGVPLNAPDGFHLFPLSGKARDVRDIFLRGITGNEGRVICSKCVKKLLIRDSAVYGVRCADGSEFAADRVIIACGGKSYPALGGRGIGYELAAQAGHQITPLFPAMAGVHTAENWVHDCAGIALDDCVAYIDLPKLRKQPERGELLFTHHGFSAFAVLDLAGQAAALLAAGKKVPLRINFTPGTGMEQWRERFAQWRKNSGTKKVLTLLSEYLPRKVAAALLEDSEVIAARWRGAEAEKVLHRIVDCPFDITGSDTWDKAMVTAGGVELKQIVPETLESRLVSGVFFAGEVLDVTGPCGGYNITWALASGRAAGCAAAGK